MRFVGRVSRGARESGDMPERILDKPRVDALLSRRIWLFAMEFGDPQLEKIVADHPRPTIRMSFNMESSTARDIAQAGLIDEIIRDPIRRAAFVLSDLTQGNSGAYWEAGFAEGGGVPVDIHLRKRSVRKLPTLLDEFLAIRRH